jgi:LacI family transcriptional regulator
VLPDLHGEFFSEIVRGMDKEASRRGYLLLLSNMHSGMPQSASALKALRGRVDGMIVMAPHLSESELAAALPGGTPAILVNTPLGDRNGIRLDNAAGAEAVAKHFLELERSRILHIAGAMGNVDAIERAEAFRKALSGKGVQLETVQGDFTEESGESGIRSLLDSGASFDAVFAANDMMASGAIQALRDAGLRVPEDVAIAGFDDVPLARHIGLTTVRVRIAELGERAVERLLAVLDGGDEAAGQELHSPELVVRATTHPK